MRLFLAISTVLVGVACASASKAVTITNVTISGYPTNPSITVTGSGFGSEPSSQGTAFPGYSGVDFGSQLYFNDNGSKGFQAGYGASGSGDYIGLVVSQYTDTLIVFTLGSTYSLYYYPVGDYAVELGDPYTVTIKGTTSVTTDVGSAYAGFAAAPEPSALLLLATGLPLLFFCLRQRVRC